MMFSGVLSAFFRFAIALVSFRLGPRGSLRAAISMSVSNIKASRSICSDSRIGCIDVRLLAARNLCRGVHSSSVSSPSVDKRRQTRYRDTITRTFLFVRFDLPESRSSSHKLCLRARLPALPILISSLCPFGLNLLPFTDPFIEPFAEGLPFWRSTACVTGRLSRVDVIYTSKCESKNGAKKKNGESRAQSLAIGYRTITRYRTIATITRLVSSLDDSPYICVLCVR